MRNDFYRSKEWEKFRQVVILERIAPDGLNYCESCGKPILRPYDCIAHHKIPLTDLNVNDANVSLNPDNIMLVHHRCHNYIHNKLGMPQQAVYIVYGSPCSGKSTYVRENQQEGDLIVDMDSIYQSISGLERYSKPYQLKPIAFGVRDYLIDAIRTRNGRWATAWVIGGYPYRAERERLARTLDARVVHIDTPMDVCLSRLEEYGDGRDVEAWRGFIEEYFRTLA